MMRGAIWNFITSSIEGMELHSAPSSTFNHIWGVHLQSGFFNYIFECVMINSVPNSFLAFGNLFTMRDLLTH